MIVLALGVVFLLMFLISAGWLVSALFSDDCNHDSPWECEDNGCRRSQ